MSTGVLAESIQGYRDLLSSRATRQVMLWAIVGRLPMGTTALALVLLVRGTGGSYAAAGAISAANALTSAVGAPIGGRLVDRYGATRVLTAYGIVHPAVVMVLVGIAWADLSVWLLGAAAAVAGFVFPPIGSAARSLWPILAPEEPLRSKAFALEATVQELAFVAGPLVVGVLTAVFASSAGMVGTAVASLIGVLGFAATSVVRSIPYGSHDSDDRHLLRALRPQMIRRIIIFSLFYGVSFGALEVALPAFAEDHGGRALGAICLAAWSCGSLVGGLIAGLLPPGDPVRRLQVISTLYLAALLLPIAAPSVPLMSAIMFVVGLPIAPSFAITYGLVQSAALTGTQSEVFGWLTMAIVVGVAAGAAVAGGLITHVEVDAAFLLAVAGGVAAVAAARTRRRPAGEMLPG